MRLLMSNLYHQVGCCLFFFVVVSRKTRRVFDFQSYIPPTSTFDERGGVFQTQGVELNRLLCQTNKWTWSCPAKHLFLPSHTPK